MSAAPHPAAAFVDRLVFGRRGLTLAAFAAATLALGWLASGLRVDAGFTKLLPVEHEYMQTFLEYRDDFGGADSVAVALRARDGNMFTPEFFALLNDVTDAVFFLPGVDRTQVYSVLTPNVRYLEVVEDGLASGNVLPPDFEPTAEGLETVRENIIKAGIVGRLVANDFSGALIAAKLQEFRPGAGARLDYFEVARRLEDIRAGAEAGGLVDVHIVGFAKVVGDIADGAARVALFFAVTLAITALFVFAFTRSARLTAMLLGCALTAMVWQLGALAGLGYGIDPMSILVPFLVFAIGVSHGVQMVGAARAETLAGAAPLEAARNSLRRLLLPGTVALASDTVGFVAIALIEVPVIQEIAVAASLGVAAIVLTNLGLLPALLSWAPPGAGGAQPPRLAPLWKRLSFAARPGPALAVIAAAALLGAVGAFHAPSVRIGDQHRGVPELRETARYNIDAAAITGSFDIGVDVLTVIGETAPEGCIDYAVMETLDRFEWRMRNIEGVQSVAALTATVRALAAGLKEGAPKWRAVPRDPRVLAQTGAFIPTSSGLLNADCSVMPVMIYTADHKSGTIERIVAAVKRFDAEEPGAPIRFRLAAGNVGVMAAANEEVAAAQFPILGYVYGAVVVLCMLFFRSLAATVCIAAPLALASLLAYALMAALEIGLKVSTLPVVALGIGIGVDYGIYVYGRLRLHLAEGLDFAAAWERALSTAGAAVALTGLTLAAAVATWIAAPLKLQADMGKVLTFMFLVNMVGAIILLPALGAWLIRRRR